jgi:hypothetical protein
MGLMVLVENRSGIAPKSPPNITYQKLTGTYSNNDTLIAGTINHGIDEN